MHFLNSFNLLWRISEAGSARFAEPGFGAGRRNGACDAPGFHQRRSGPDAITAFVDGDAAAVAFDNLAASLKYFSSSSPTLRQNKLECFNMTNYFQPY